MPTPEENAAPETTTGETPAVFEYETWLAAQPDEVKAGLEQHTSGLTSALTSERESRKDFEKQARDLAEKAEKGSEAQAQLTAVADKLADAERRADFADAAGKAGVSDMKLAYIAAREDEMFDRFGRVDFAKLQEAHPALFGKPAPAAGNAGAGTITQPAPGGKNAEANDAIRRASGRY
jgi:hypothetical protein